MSHWLVGQNPRGGGGDDWGQQQLSRLSKPGVPDLFNRIVMAPS